MAERGPERETSFTGSPKGPGGGQEDEFTVLTEEMAEPPPPPDPRTIVNGLLLKQRGQDTPFAAFTYVLPPIMETSVPVDWKILVTENVESQHIRCYELQPSDELSSLIPEFQKAYAMAIVLINVDDSYTVPEACLQGVEEPPIPVVVLSHTDGQSLLEQLDHYDGGDVFARVDAESVVDVPTHLPGREAAYMYPQKQGPRPPLMSPDALPKEPGVGQRIKQFFGAERRTSFDLKGEIKSLMFHPSTGEPLVVCDDPGKFTIVMSTFQHYERNAKTDSSHSDVSDTLKKLMKHFPETFAREFPFYIILAYRTHVKTAQYQCEELGNFIMSCMDRLETMDPHIIAGTFNNFLRQDDFDVMFGEDSTCSVFYLLEMACIEMGVKVSYKIRVRGQADRTKLYPHFVYHRMLWLSLALRIHSQRGVVTRSTQSFWKDHLVVHQSKLVMDSDTVSDLKKGLAFGNLIRLPPDLTFTSEHMADFLASDGHVRPFQHVSNYFKTVEVYIPLDMGLLNFITSLRAVYDSWLKQPRTNKHSKVSVGGTLAATLQEGVAFLDTLHAIWSHRKANFDTFDSEMTKWLMLLLQLIDITGPSPELHLRKFLTGRSGVVKKYRQHITRYVISVTHNNFGKMPVQQFFPLYKSFLIWPNKFLEEYLSSYVVPSGVKINDPTWKEFFSLVVERFGGAQHHRFLLDFFQAVAERYLKDKRAAEFVLDLLLLNVPKLFASEGGGRENDVSANISLEFMRLLKDYIARNSLKVPILAQMKDILKAISDERNEFQALVLQVLQKEVVPEFKALQGSQQSDLNPSLLAVLLVTVNTITKELSWLQALTPKQRFCWGIVGTLCAKIPISSEQFEWVLSYSYLTTQLGFIYNAYCNGKQLSEIQRVLTEHFPVEIASSPSEDIRRYFAWVRKVQNVLMTWRDKFLQLKVNYDDVLLYASTQAWLNNLGLTVCATSAVIDSTDIQKVKNMILQNFERLNILLIRYIPGQPDARWCTLPQLLEDYGVPLPSRLLDPITRFVQLPGEQKVLSDPVANPLPSNTSGAFQPGHEIFVRLSKSLQLCSLTKLVQELEEFLEPILDHQEMLIFFKLHRSEIFNKHIQLQLRKESDLLSPESVTRSPGSVASPAGVPVISIPAPFFSVPGFARNLEGTDGGIPISTLVRALSQTKELLERLMKGTAAYYDIIAEGELKLETLDIEKEFETLTAFSVYVNLTSTEQTGLSGVRSMLELFQYTIQIEAIQNVCDQYQLKGCQQDRELLELRRIVEELKEERNRASLTPIEATRKMERVKKLLCLDNPKCSPKSLDLFAAVTDSAAFYQFVRDKHFFGEKGQVAFRQQYTLITSHLQHEEYDETVLNHLYAAFKFIQPFMDQRQTFHELMEQVTKLDATNGLKQLQTVNSNITLIRLWFSRAEGDTLQNVAKELDGILQSGYYTFRLSSASTSRAEIMLEYDLHSSLPPGLRQPAQGSQPPSLDDMGPRSTFSRMDSRGDEYLSTTLERWNSEQINDFVRKLGFLDTEKEGGDSIKHFLHINEVAEKLLDLYVKLKELGHPQYLQPTVTRTLHCSIQKSAADEVVKDTEKELTAWTQRVAELRSQYDWLLFFSVPKLLTIYGLLRSSEPEEQLDQVMQEVSFLCFNDQSTRNAVKANMKKSVVTCKKSIASSEAPMMVVGRFLGTLFFDHVLPTRAGLGMRSRSVSHVSLPTESMQLLHYCPHYQQIQLVRLIISIYDGVPEAFEVFHCRPSSTEEELSLFLKRASKHPLHYLLLEVNRLPFQLQEFLMQVHLSIQTVAKESRQLLEAGQPATACTPTINFVETSPSVLREMPWVQLREHQESGPSLTFEQARKKCLQKVAIPEDFACIQLVYGYAGDGKTHYIKSQLEQCSDARTIAVNEAFTALNAINKLRSLPLTKKNCGIFFNFTVLPPGECVDESESERYQELLEVIGWFFFDLLLLGYVEDPPTGRSFRIPGSLGWAIFVEVPSRDLSISPGDALRQFREELPVLGLLGTPHYIHPETPYSVDGDVKLVCKYLRAYHIGGPEGIDKLYREGRDLVKFSTGSDLTAGECQELLSKYMPDYIKKTKITQRLFIKYMKIRCSFLDKLPTFNYNAGFGEYKVNEQGNRAATDTRQLGSTLMSTMLKEVGDFCDPAIKDNWSLKPHQQLIYDFRDGGASLGLISLHPDQLRGEDKVRFKRIGVEIPSMTELYSRKLLDRYLSRALSVPLENDRLTPVDDNAYVLTLDYTIKMLNINERYNCGVPVIIEGETGVGKTALVEMLSKLWNHSLLVSWNRQKNSLLESIRRELGEMSPEASENYQTCLSTVASMGAGQKVKEDDLVLLCNLPHSRSPSRKLFSLLRTELLAMRKETMITLLTLKDSRPLDSLFDRAQEDDTLEVTATLLLGVMNAQIKPTFHKVNVHAAMTPAEILALLHPVFDQARALKEGHQSRGGDAAGSRVPFVTVFLDEVNTSSCVGLFKEVIVDRTFDGEAIPDNLFIVAACNPHRGNSLASHMHNESWVRGTYYVRRLHPTLQFLMWDYGSLDEAQERDYINAKMKMLNKQMPNAEVATLTDIIVVSQKLMREYAFQQLKSSAVGHNEARISSRSCVSQRDIQRVFTFYQWLRASYEKYKQHGDNTDYNRRAVLVALGIVYYMRLNSKFRRSYEEFVNKEKLPSDMSFRQAFEEELEYYMQKVELPPGIARTQALKENLFATIICAVTHTPLIIVGPPGSSKTLSFNLAIANLKGQESKVKVFRDTEVFCSLDPHYYQCSRRTTSNEIQTVFSRAINRQRSHSKVSLPIYCVVFMDEAGLPEESHESLKVLHYHLDRQEVSFVAITNHVLDAAKTNRAVSLFRPEVSEKDLETLAKGCLCSDPVQPKPEEVLDLTTIVKFCKPYLHFVKESRDFQEFFGLRDFIHFVNYLRRKRHGQLTPLLVMEALERNFNGSDLFDRICRSFLSVVGSACDEVHHRSILRVLQDSLEDRPQGTKDISENEVRYKLIIDPSEDDSLVRLLFSFGVLERGNTKMFVCSDFPGDSQLQKINTIAAIRHSAIQGHTVVMSQTDDIHESFYDLFNQRFRRIDDPQDGPRYYTNIAIGAHLKPCRVHPDFQCVVVVKKSEVKDTPAPFLNRFEKYCITHRSLLETAVGNLPPCLAILIRSAMEKAQKFIKCVGGAKSLYGLKEETLDSLILTLLPPLGHTYEPMGDPGVADNSQTVPVLMLQELLMSLRHCAGFSIPSCTVDELYLDAHGVYPLIMRDPGFEALLMKLTHDEVVRAVKEAMETLHQATGPTGSVVQYDISMEACLAITVLEQWLVRYLTKRLMQLMTSEAVILHRRKVPSSYLENYLTCDTHFSLKQLIVSHLDALENSGTNRWAMPTKVLCFTRSSQLIHQLPMQHPMPAFEAQDSIKAHQTLGDLVYPHPARLMVCKLSSVLSQSNIQELLRTFFRSESAQVLLLIANMQEATTKMVNHIRIMIEEAESSFCSNEQAKLTVLLLHFPPAKFFDSCYPSLFLQTWDHCYLDTIAHSAIRGVVNIGDWFRQCCFPLEGMPPPEEDSLLLAMKEIMSEAIPVLSSRVFFGSKQGRSFNSYMNASQRSKALRELLFDKEVGGVLCKRFRSYWKPKFMIEQLEKAASFTHSRESTLNITDFIQTVFKNAFFDFLVYMISRINEEFNIDVIFNASCSPAVRALFLDILQVFPIPKLAQLKVLSTSLPKPKPSLFSPRFPFFRMVSEVMEVIVEQSWEEANQKLDILHEEETDAPTQWAPDQMVVQETLHKVVLEKVKNKAEESPNDVLSITLKSMSLHLELWQHYFADFTLRKLHLESGVEGKSGITEQILVSYFGQLHQQETVTRVVILHVYIRVYQLDLARMATVLRPLNKIQDVARKVPELLSPLPSSPTRQFISAVKQTQHPLGTPEDLSAFIVNTLFHALVGSSYSRDSLAAIMEKLGVWYKAYRDVLTLPTLRSQIYCALLPGKPGSSQATEARLNVMQATFLALQTSSVLNEDLLVKSQQIFQTLFTRYFDQELTLRSAVPHLAEVTEVTVEVLSETAFSPGLYQDNQKVRLLMEGLFAHFFSPYRPSYHPEDARWFMELANDQLQWQVTDMSRSVIVRSYSEALDQESESRERTIATEVPQGAIGMNVFKLYLARVLGSSDPNSEEAGPLQLYHPLTRSQAGEVLTANRDLGTPAPYIPSFYQDCPPIIPGLNAENKMMQQPLAHLYFLTVLEHLLAKELRLGMLIRSATNIQKLCVSEETLDSEKVLLFIELQAVTQVAIQVLGMHLNPAEPQKLGEIHSLVEDLNRLLDDEGTGGGGMLGHSMVLSLHMLKLLKSSRKFTELLTFKYDAICRGISALKPIHQQLTSPPEPKPHLLPFMLPGSGNTDLGSLYQKVSVTMVGVHEGTHEVEDLVMIAEDCQHSVRMTAANPVTSARGNHSDMRLCFRMMVWLTAYYEFYDKKIKSETLCYVVDGQLLPYLKEEGYIRLIQCFLNPGMMLQVEESPNPLRDDEQVIELTREGGHRPVQRQGVKVDPLYQLFVPQDPDKEDQSDVDLRHALANLVGVTLGCPSRSNHLWYHMFAPEDLQETYLTGFMYKSKIHPDGLLYDCGVELSPDGQFGRQDYLKHASRGTYSLHSLYLLLWANFGTFCIALLTQIDANRHIHGPLISEWLSLRHYCVSQLRTVWMHMRNNLAISEEQRSFLVMRCCKRFYELMNLEAAVPDCMRGVFRTQQEVDGYERMWHSCVYQPSWNELQPKFTQYSQLWQHKLFMDLRHLEQHYPHFPLEKDFTHTILSSGDIQQHTEGGDLRLLSQFALEWPRLQAGGLLLPDLVEFYQWLHTALAHLVTSDKATALTIGRVVDLAARRYSQEMGEHLRAMYQRVKDGYNHYLELIGGAIGVGACAAVRRGNKIYTIEDDIPLLHFLSDVMDEEQGNDWLYTVIADIVSAHNAFVEGLYAIVTSQERSSLARLLPEEPTNVYTTEVNDNHCIVGRFKSLHNLNDFLQLIRSRYQLRCSPPPSSSRRSLSISHSENFLPVERTPAFQLTQLQEDVVATFLAGKPLIHSPQLMRTPFKFRDVIGIRADQADVVGSALDITGIRDQLQGHQQFMAPVEETQQKRMDYDFHTAGYHSLVAVVTALNTVAGHLIKTLLEPQSSPRLAQQTVAEYMLTLYQHLHKNKEVLEEIGIHTQDFTSSQLACIAELPLTSVFSCLQFFVQWVEEGVYDFSGLPFSLKTRIASKDKESIQLIPRDWNGTRTDLLEELRQMNEVLAHSEGHLTKLVGEAAHKPIVEFLLDIHTIAREDRLPRYIPQTILIQHYMHFRLQLRRLTLAEEKQIGTGEGETEGERERSYWEELVSDLWEKLPHLREESYGGEFIYDPATGRYGFQEGEYENESEFGDDLMEDTEEEEEERIVRYSWDNVEYMSMPDMDEPFERTPPPVTPPPETSPLTASPRRGTATRKDSERTIEDERRTFETLIGTDPEFYQKMLSMAKSLRSDVQTMEQRAATYKTVDVVKFLQRIGLGQHAAVFRDNDITGDMLVAEGAGDAFFSELGIASALDKLKITVLFKRELRGASESSPVAVVLEFLEQQRLGQYTEAFRRHGIDGDLLLEASDAVLNELGVVSALHKVKLKTKFKNFSSSKITTV